LTPADPTKEDIKRGGGRYDAWADDGYAPGAPTASGDFRVDLFIEKLRGMLH